MYVLKTKRYQSVKYKNSPQHKAAQLWDSLHNEICAIQSLNDFKLRHTRPCKTKRRLAIILDYHVCKVTIIFYQMLCKKEKKIIVTIFIVSVFFHYRGCFFHYRGCFFIIVGVFSLSWVLFPYSI